MLDTDTKRRIDTARDILVGKVPDPKSQVEQITLALIYKFMDDMDAESEELGGKRKFFAGDFARYGWAKLMSPSLGGHEMLALYAEGIVKMPENPGIPSLFRDIFKNAFLPYRDPETLRAFLKIIDEFTYDHSERLGDAFEYLLSVLGSQGEAGQFRTPRHIIEFMVDVIDPQKHESVLDPACGTAGFLISAYKHVLDANRDKHGHFKLSPEEKGRLAQNIRGYDISPDMVRLSRANMYLHGFPDPHIFEYDTLTSQERWNEYADVILANPPFMSPKGGIRPHKRFSIEAKRSEVLFVDYMAEHLTPNGRAAIIVPEGVIFQSGTAYRKLREMLINDYLVGVISLPSGVFMPYTGVKTSILVLDRVMAKRKPAILFSEIKNIGVSLGVKRTLVEHNDLPTVLSDYRNYYADKQLSKCSWVATRKEALANDCNLTATRYRPTIAKDDQRIVRLTDVCQIIKGKYSSTATPPGPYPLILTAAEPKSSADYQLEGPAVCVPLISSLGHGKAALHRVHFADGKFALANLLVALLPTNRAELDAKYLYYAVDARRSAIAGLMRGAANVGMKPEDLAQFQIPLPPLDVQKEIVAEIEGYQKVIDGARAVVDNYRPRIAVDPEWPMVELGEIIDRLESGVSVNSTNGLAERGQIGILKTSCVTLGVFDPEEYKVILPEECERAKCSVKRDSIIISRMNTENLVGASAYVDREYPSLFLPDRLWQTIITRPDVDVRFVQIIISSPDYRQRISGLCGGTSGSMKNISKAQFLHLKIPLPPFDIQRAIVAEIEAEQALVAANRELIVRFEKKIQAVLARVWGDGETHP